MEKLLNDENFIASIDRGGMAKFLEETPNHHVSPHIREYPQSSF